jgi:hypothetical protein
MKIINKSAKMQQNLFSLFGWKAASLANKNSRMQ